MTDAAHLKSCCASLYESELARALLGDSFHPSGPALTARLGTLLDLKPSERVLDIAAGNGASAILIGQQFGCEVVGIDLGAEQVARAAARAADAGVTGRVRFERGDAERLPAGSGSFDAVICECAFCTFPDKNAAAREISRVLRPGGRFGMSDLTRSGPLPVELEGLLAWIACIADARPVAEYTACLEAEGVRVASIENHDDALSAMVREIQGRLMATELLVKLQKMDLPDADFEKARLLARSAAEAVRTGLLGYSLITTRKPSCS